MHLDLDAEADDLADVIDLDLDVLAVRRPAGSSAVVVGLLDVLAAEPALPGMLPPLLA